MNQPRLVKAYPCNRTMILTSDMTKFIWCLEQYARTGIELSQYYSTASVLSTCVFIHLFV